MKVLVVGAGAAGLIAGIFAAKNGNNVTIIEKNSIAAKKLRITGKGRCNITNNCSEEDFIQNIPTNPRFLYSAINAFAPKDAIEFFENLGLKTKTERGRRVFPLSDKAADVVNALLNCAKSLKVNFVTDEVKSLIIKNKSAVGCMLKSGREVFADKIILATGGKSYPKTGSNGSGYMLARQAGHSITSIKPSLVPLVSDDAFCALLQGLDLKNIAISVINKENNKTIYADFGELLFTHFGLSGPVILSASAHLNEKTVKNCIIKCDLKPALSLEQLEKRILKDFTKSINKDISNAFFELLPKSLIPIVINKWGIDPSKKCNIITKTERIKLAVLLKAFEINITGFRPIDEAIITCGGISTKEINPKTMESKLCKNLFFAGEIIDVDGYTGGFNLQIAWSTGYLAGNNSKI